MIQEEPKIEAPVQVSLDAHVQLLKDYKECQTAATFWADRLKIVKGQLAAIMGEATEGTMGGEAVVFYDRQNRFNGGDFAKKYPETAQYFTREFTVKKLDTDWLKQARPELWEEFQTRAMRNTWEIPGDA